MNLGIEFMIFFNIYFFCGIHGFSNTSSKKSLPSDNSGIENFVIQNKSGAESG